MNHRYCTENMSTVPINNLYRTTYDVTVPAQPPTATPFWLVVLISVVIPHFHYYCIVITVYSLELLGNKDGRNFKNATTQKHLQQFELIREKKRKKLTLVPNLLHFLFDFFPLSIRTRSPISCHVPSCIVHCIWPLLTRLQLQIFYPSNRSWPFAAHFRGRRT